MLEKNFKDIISNIKEEIINTQIKTMQEANSNLIMLYFKLGKIVSENKQYGNNFTKQVSTELKLTFPNMKGFSERNIRSMRKNMLTMKSGNNLLPNYLGVIIYY